MSDIHPIFEKILAPYMIDPETSNLPEADKPHYYEEYAPKDYDGEICALCGKTDQDPDANHLCPNCGKFPMQYDCYKARC